MTEAGYMKPIIYAWVVIQPLLWRPIDVQREATLNALCRQRQVVNNDGNVQVVRNAVARQKSTNEGDEEASARSLRPSPVDERRRGSTSDIIQHPCCYGRSQFNHCSICRKGASALGRIRLSIRPDDQCQAVGNQGRG